MHKMVLRKNSGDVLGEIAARMDNRCRLRFSPVTIDLPELGLRRWLYAVGGALVLLALTVIVGRFTGMLALVTIVPSGAPMAFTTAHGFLINGLGFLAYARGAKLWGKLLGSASVILGAGTIIFYAI